MGRRVTTTLAAVALLALFAVVTASGHSSSGVKGVLLNTTCPGPCGSPCSAGTTPCPPSCPPCTTKICPERPMRNSAIVCPASSSVCNGCVAQPQPQPYTGPNAHVVVRRASDGAVVARRSPTAGHFRIRLGPGAYRVHGFVAEPCWKGQTEDAVVHSESFIRLELDVHNDCVVSPAGMSP